MADHIRDQGIRPALVLCSPAKRARQTLELVAPALGAPEVQIEERIYGSSADDLLELLQSLPNTLASVMVIGHNPGLQELAVVLVKASAARTMMTERFPTGVLVTLSMQGDWSKLGPAKADLVAFVEPRALPG
jgi:phosphohistidine phosphatase